jgi:DNA polymerase-1
MTTPRLLIDAELLLYRAAAGAEYEAEWAPDEWTWLCRHGDARAAFQDQVASIRELAPHHEPLLVFGDRASFRYSVWPGYKSNRKGKRKPCGFGPLVEWIKESAATRNWLAPLLPGIEGDDALGVLAAPGKDIIASDDKDMLTLPGLLIRNGELVDVSQEAADRAFFTQALVGDAADGYPGCPTYGAKTAEKWLASWSAEADLWRQVKTAYLLKSLPVSFALQQARCARILRPGEYDLEQQQPILWEPPA